ncbi:MAG: alpha-L-fucosidase [Candidatus Margulisiibacteriota bacterium]
MLRTKIFLLLLLLPILYSCASQLTPSVIHYKPTLDSLKQHPLPEWYDDAKLGIMIHYGIYSVDDLAWAPVVDPSGFGSNYFINNPYAEWNYNTMNIPGSPIQQHLLTTLGTIEYFSFISSFDAQSQLWNPEDWVNIIKSAGAKYAVLVTKHCDGFTLWPCPYSNPYIPSYESQRDIVGDYVNAMRADGTLKVGFYYCGGYDWLWSEGQARGGAVTDSHITVPITNNLIAIAKIPQDINYIEYCNNQYRDLITRYHPDLLWNDVAMPLFFPKLQLIADYYNSFEATAGAAGVVINNRWAQDLVNLLESFSPTQDQSLIDLALTTNWFDYYNIEYPTNGQYCYTTKKWEADRALGYSFGYNKQEETDQSHVLSAEALVKMLSDIVSKNGNLLLAITPKANGTIPTWQVTRVQALGNWLSKNGTSIYATRPWVTPEGFAEVSAGSTFEVRYTRSKDNSLLYVILMTNPKSQDVILTDRQFLGLAAGTTITVLNGSSPFTAAWQAVSSGTLVKLSALSGMPNDDFPLAFKISPNPVSSSTSSQ